MQKHALYLLLFLNLFFLDKFCQLYFDYNIRFSEKYKVSQSFQSTKKDF